MNPKNQLAVHIIIEISTADKFIADGKYDAAFHHLERAHVLGQAKTFDHTRIHWRMLKLGWKMRSLREVFGQLIRIVGASTKTPFGIYPAGNTGGANVWFFKSMAISDDLKNILDSSK